MGCVDSVLCKSKRPRLARTEQGGSIVVAALGIGLVGTILVIILVIVAILFFVRRR